MDTISQIPTTQDNSQLSSDQMIQNTPQPKSSSRTSFYLAIAVIVIVLIVIGGYIYTKHHNNQMATTSVPSQTEMQHTAISITPAISPVTSANVNQTLNNTDTTMQQSLDQANSDLNDINNIDTSQDNTSGL